MINFDISNHIWSGFSVPILNIDVEWLKWEIMIKSKRYEKNSKIPLISSISFFEICQAEFLKINWNSVKH